jgi:hypothetical protein
MIAMDILGLGDLNARAHGIGRLEPPKAGPEQGLMA